MTCHSKISGLLSNCDIIGCILILEVEVLELQHWLLGFRVLSFFWWNLSCLWNAVYPSVADQEDRDEIESDSYEEDDDESSDDDQPSASRVTSSGGSEIAASSSLLEASSRGMWIVSFRLHILLATCKCILRKTGGGRWGQPLRSLIMDDKCEFLIILSGCRCRLDSVPCSQIPQLRD